MRYFLTMTLTAILAVLPGTAALANQTGGRSISGVVAVSTGPMQAYTQSIGRDLAAGDDVFLNDEVETGKATRAQVLLRDESVFSLAPSSKVVFDEFVYDPAAQSGALNASLISGGLRFVSGRIASKSPENIRLKVGKASVGIRGTEILATHGAAGSTLVLLSGAMDVTTAAGTQSIDRPGFGIDVSADGILGVVRQVPIEELVNMLSAPLSQDEEASSQDGDEASDEEGEEEAADNGDNNDEGGDEETADAADTDGQGTETESADSESADTQTADAGDEAEAAPSAFDQALAGGGDDEGASMDLAVTAAPAPVLELPAVGETQVSSSDVVATVVDNLAEDEQTQAANNTANLSVVQLSNNKINTNPYYSSTANLLIRAPSYFTSSAQFNVTRDLLREKFPDSNAPTFDGFEHLPKQETMAASALDGYDGVLIYLDYGDTTNDLSNQERDAYRAFAQTANKKVVVIGRTEANSQTVNSVMPIFHNGASGYQYVATSSPSGEATGPLEPVSGSSSDLLLGVDAFSAKYTNSGGFPYYQWERDLVEDANDTPISVDNGLLLWESNYAQALDFGDMGSVFFGRFSCGSDASADGALGRSINANFVSDGRAQFCRNLFSSLAPDNKLVDVEVGSLSAVNGGSQSYELASHTDIFKINGSKLLLKAGVQPTAGDYQLSIRTTEADGNVVNAAVTVSVDAAAAQARVISSRQTATVGQALSIDTTNMKTQAADLDALSWASLSGNTVSGAPGQTGMIVLHYRETQNGETYDRFHEVVVNYDCASDYCTDFATSMDTQNALVYNTHFALSDFNSWEIFFQRFHTATATSTGSFTHQRAFSGSTSYSGSDPYLTAQNGDFTHNLTVNYGLGTGSLNSAGTFDGVFNEVSGGGFEQSGADYVAGSFNMDWTIDFTACNGSNNGCRLDVANADAGSVTQNLNTTGSGEDTSYVALHNMALPNGKLSLIIKDNFLADHPDGCTAGACRKTVSSYEAMTPQ